MLFRIRDDQVANFRSTAVTASFHILILCNSLSFYHSTVNTYAVEKAFVMKQNGRAIAQAVSRWDLWWTKWRWGRFSPSTPVSHANLHSTNFSIITLTYHPELVQ
jgi:hypothetical protein